jgi:hydrogenase maturation protease
VSAWRVIGVGNRDRGDDGAGLALARRLRHKAPAADVHECAGGGFELLELWRGAENVVVVDAARAGGRPGAVRRFEAQRAPLPAGLARGSSHAAGVADAIELARSLGELPRRVVVYAVEARDFRHGEALSPPVRRALERLEARLLRVLAA